MRRLVCLLMVFTTFAAVCAAAPVAAASVTLRPPVDAPVLDPFRLPYGPYGAGNRGIEYDTAAGALISAAGPGVVVFAGAVAGDLHITVGHGGGLRTTYSFVDRLLVKRGDRVDTGGSIAVAGGPLHFSTRVDGRYVDPTALFGTRMVNVALVPHDDPEIFRRFLDLAERSEQLHLFETWQRHEGGGFLSTVRRAIGIVSNVPFGPYGLLDPEARFAELVHLGEVLGTLASELDQTRLIADLVVGLSQALDPPPCTPSGALVTPPSERRIAVVVDGLDSSSTEAGAMSRLDLGVQGYEPEDIVRFSYRGGIVPPLGDGWATSIPSSHYGSGDTRGDVEDVIPKLTTTLEAVAAANPGVTIDVFGHSLGGLLARHSLIAVDLAAVPVAVAVTIAAPHQGSATAELIEMIELTAPGTIAADALAVGWPEHILVAPVGEDLSKSGFAGDTASLAFPEEVHAVTIGARADLVVPATDARAPGAVHVVVGGSVPLGAHSDILGWVETAREVRLALAGLAPACEGAVDRVLDVVVPRSIEYAVHAVSGVIAAADMP